MALPSSTSSQSSSSGAVSGFFSTLTADIGGVTNAIKSAVPIWGAAVQTAQQVNQLANPTVQQNAAIPNLNGLGQQLQAAAGSPWIWALVIGGVVLAAAMIKR